MISGMYERIGISLVLRTFQKSVSAPFPVLPGDYSNENAKERRQPLPQRFPSSTSIFIRPLLNGIHHMLTDLLLLCRVAGTPRFISLHLCDSQFRVLQTDDQGVLIDPFKRRFIIGDEKAALRLLVGAEFLFGGNRAEDDFGI